MTIPQITIPQNVSWIIEQLNSQGYEAFAVGGCVRDTILGREPEDWDITTSAKPEQVKAIFRKTVDTGIQHGTVTVMIYGKGYEITTYRIDGEYEDSRHPKSVEFTKNLLEDLKRRDFTINAMAYSRKSGIVDAFCGQEDLRRKIIRCVGKPVDRFTEDALRILRAVRFSAQLDFTIEPETLQAIYLIAPNLAKVSRERIQAELTKLLLSSYPMHLRLVHKAGMDKEIAADFPKIFEESSLVLKETLSRLTGLPNKKHLRWAAVLCQTDDKTAKRILKELKLDNDTIERAVTLVQWHDTELFADKWWIRRAMCQIGPDLFEDLLKLKAVLYPDKELEMAAQVRRLKDQIQEDGECISLKTLAVTGRDLIQAGVRPGPGLGAKLRELLDLVLEDPSMNDKDLLLAKAGETS